MKPSTTQRARLIAGAALMAALWSPATQAQVVEPPPAPEGLKGVPVPEPADLSTYVANRAAAIRLGKALFWDMQLGSDGKTACASCHFQAGADPRSRNQVSPGLLRVNADKSPNPDTTFQVGGPNYQLKPSDFPFHRFQDPRNRNSAVLRTSNDVASSQGVFRSNFTGGPAGAQRDLFNLIGDTTFQQGGIQTRRVEPRNAPTMINAIFNFRNFWDGRATFLFNGVSPFGAMDTAARVYRTDAAGVPQPVQVRIGNSSLASLATGPALSEFEMSAIGRTWPDIGRRLLTAKPLALQQVNSTDSVLATLRDPAGRGLTGQYRAMVEAAFQPQWWNANATQTVTINGRSFTQAEANFSLFFGLAIQAYGATLVSSDSPFDRHMAGNTTALTADARAGLALFFGKGKCADCHGGAEFTNASVRKVRQTPMSRMIMGNGATAVYDEGFYNIGIGRTLNDIANGANNPTGRPLAMSALARQVDAATFRQLTGIDPNVTVAPGERIAVNGAFKTPTIRNAELTAPYFHNGSVLTLRQVVEFYNRGGNHFNENIADVDADIQPLGLTETEIGQLVAFIKSTTDDRVRFERAPFDHPEITVPNGHSTDAAGRVVLDAGAARDSNLVVPAVGAAGRTEPPAFLDNFGGGTHAVSVNHTGMCLELNRIAGPWVDGTIILQANCNGAVDQDWAQEPVNGGFQLRNAATGKCIDVAGASTLDGARVTQWACGSGDHQVFNWSNGKLVARHSGKCLAISRALTTQGAGVIQATCSSTGNEGTFTRRSGGTTSVAVSTTSVSTAPTTPPPTQTATWVRCANQGGVCQLGTGAARSIRYVNPLLNQYVESTASINAFCLPNVFGLPFDTTGAGYCELRQ